MKKGAQALRHGTNDLLLLPERAVYEPATRSLYIADTHWGKTQTFRSKGIPLPHGNLEADLDRLARVIEVMEPRHVYILGDIVHGRAGLAPHIVAQVATWIDAHASITLRGIRGNHDKGVALPSVWKIDLIEAGTQSGGPALHHDPAVANPDEFGLCGHLHPAVQLQQGRERLRLPCYWQRGRQLILPAFASFTGLTPITPQVSDTVFAIADDRVRDVSAYFHK